MRVGPFHRILSYLPAYRGRIAVGLACIPATVGLELFLPRYIGGVFDRLDGTRDAESLGGSFLLTAALVVAGVALVQSILRFVTRFNVIGASREIEREIKDDFARHLNKLPFSWFDRAKTGDVISRATQDVELLRFTVGPSLMYGATVVLMLPGALAVMAATSLTVTAAVLGVLVAMVVSVRLQFHRIEDRSQAVQEAIGKISEKTYEDVSGIRVLKAFGRETSEAVAFAKACRDYAAASNSLARGNAVVHALIGGMKELGILTVLVVGCFEVARGGMTKGEFFSFLLYLQILTWPLIATGWILSAIPRARAAAVRVEEFFAVPPEDDSAALAAPPPLQGTIEVRGLSFRYTEKGPLVLADVSFALPAGKTLGLVGPVGAGKSTLLALIVRLYPPPAGTIFLDGRDVLSIPLHVLRDAFSFAPQDVFLFSDSVRGNIAFSRKEEDLDPARLAFAIENAALGDDLSAFPKGMDQVVGERGMTLSGGQKQRVSLTRALVSDRRILALDDTLSAVDHSTEKKILGSLARTRAGRTNILVAHRLSVVKEADLILTLEAGRITERGTHEELVAAGGFYARTWEKQQAAAELEQL